ncbi:MAG: hypothetical protein JNM12_04670 [Alphaproteobacteria bacterium]|nr:hypothetical protein [Alphaproteobacteria bacterium]
MFGFGEKSKIKAAKVGAREKIRLAQEIAAKGGGAVLSKKEGKETSVAVSVITIYVMAYAVSWMVSQKYISSGQSLGLRLGWDELDRLLFKAGNINVTGTEVLDYGLLIAFRAVMLLLAAGVVPFVALVVQKSLDAAGMNPFRTVWGTPIGILLVIIGMKEYFIPLLMEVFGIF